MAYIPTIWVNGVAPAINATNLNKIEAGISNALPIDGSVAMIGGLTLSGNPTLALHATTKQYVDAISYIDAGAGLTKSGSTISIGQSTGIVVGANDISLATLGTASGSATFAKVNIDAYGRVSSYTPVVAGDITGLVGTIQNPNVGVVVSGTGLSGGGTFSLNQSSQQTITITSNATSTNTVSTIVARDASGNFSAGTITAALSGNASTATTATNIAAGSAGAIPYQTSASNTSFLSIGAANQVFGVNSGATGYDYKTLSGSNVTVTNSAGSISIGIPQSVATGATPTFAQLSISNAPSADSHAATKAYVDGVAQGLRVKQSVKVATTGNLATSAAGATVLTLSSALTTLDGVALSANDRILVKDQTGATMNGIYVYTNSTTLTRSSDADSSPSGDVVAGIFTFVEQGASYADTGWVLTTDNPITIGTTGLTFAQFSGAGQVLAGTGLTKIGNTISIANTAVTTGTYKSVTVNQQGQVTSGTNPTNLAGYGITDAIDTSATSQTKSGGLNLGGTLNSVVLSNNSYPLLKMAFSAQPEVSASILNPIAFALTNGKPLNGDNDFASGTNNITIYDNASSGQISISRTTLAGVPNNSGYVLQFTHTGVSTTPGLGGFVQLFTSQRNKTYVQIFKAKIPSGYILSAHSNAVGDNSSDYWMSNIDGTGEWETYVRVVQAGSTGTFNTCGFIALNINGGTAPSVGSPLVWYLASCNVYETSSFVDSLRVTGGNITGALNVSGNVGIGTTSPGDKLHVEGNIYLGTSNRTIYTAGSGNLVLQTNTGTMIFTRNGAANESMRISTGGSVGIGTISPTSLLHLSGVGSTTGSLIGSIIRINDSAGTSIATTFGGIGFESPNNGPDFVIGKITENTSSALGFKNGTGTEFMRITSSGNVGIGTYGPDYKLHVAGTAKFTAGDATNFFTFHANNEFNYWNGTTGGVMYIQYRGGDLDIGNNKLFVKSSTGKVGIGTNSPNIKLHVAGATGEGILIEDTTLTKTAYLTNESGKFLINANQPISFAETGTSSTMYLSGGKVGIGTTTNTTRKLEIDGSGVGSPPLRITNTNNNVGIELVSNSSRINYLLASNYNISDSFEITPSTAAGGVTFTSPALIVSSNGRVGIGATSPGYKLDVKAGTASFEGVSGVGAIRIAGAAGSWFWLDNPATTYMRFSSGAAAGTNPMYFTDAGYLGVGVVPNVELHAKGSGEIFRMETTSATGDNFIRFYAPSATTQGYFGYVSAASNNMSIQNVLNSDLLLHTNNIERVRITAAGNVGIGSTNATSLLEVKGQIASFSPMFRIANTGVSSGYQSVMAFYTDNSTSTPFLIGKNNINDASGSAFISNQANTPMYFETNGTNRMTILAGGNVGIGTTSPSGDGTSLHIHGTTYATLHLTNNTSGLAINDGADLVVDGNSFIIRNREATGSILFRTNNGGSEIVMDQNGGLKIVDPILKANANSIVFNSATVLGGGINNVAIGGDSFRDGSFGNDNNVIIGYQAGYKSSGAQLSNVAIGAGAMYDTQGGGCVAIGVSTLAGQGAATAFYSTVVGAFAGQSIIGDYNVGVGGLSLRKGDGGASYNATIGYESIPNLTSGGRNSVLGAQAGYSLTSGLNNVFIGYDSGRNITTGSNNVVIGSLAGVTNLSDTVLIGTGTTERMRINSVGNVGIGTTSPTTTLEVNGGGSFSGEVRVEWFNVGTGTQLTDNIRIGNGMSSSTAGGFGNVAIGKNALLNHTSGGANNAIGMGALQENTSGGSNTSIGNGSMQKNITGSNNTALGINALAGSTNTSYNVAIGYNALTGNTNSASALVAIGASALTSNTTGAYGIAIGQQSLQSNTIGTANIGIGFQTLKNNTSGDANVAVGSNVLPSNTSSQNTGVGNAALYSNTSGANNSGFGHYSMLSNTTGSANTALGSNSLVNSSSGSNNIAIGFQAGYDLTTGSSNTIIGSLTGSAGMSNTMLFGAGTVERFRVDSGGSMLLGYITSNGAYKLQVNGQIYATSSTIATSDQNYKENISTIQDGLRIIKSLNPVQFNWKEHPVHSFDTTTPTVGFIAQEVKQSLIDKPYLNSIVKESKTVYEKDGEAIEEAFLGIAESNLIAILTKAVQELSQKVEDLEAKLADK